MLDPASRTRLKPTTARHFQGDTLFDRLARVVCEADCLPRKELYESWHVARRVRRRLHGGRVVDLACGHALVAHVMLLLDDRSSGAVAVDRRLPRSAERLAAALGQAWPRLAGAVTLLEAPLDGVELAPGDVVVATHACGTLTDLVLERAIAAGASVAVVPCCHSEARCDDGGLAGWMDPALAIDATRARRLAASGYDVHTQELPIEITAKNRLLIGKPRPM